MSSTSGQSDPFVQAVMLHQAGQLPQALEAYGRAVRQQPNNHAIHANMGVAFLALGRNSEALDSLDRALALKGDDAVSHNNRANVLRAMGRSAEALESYKQALQLMPRMALFQINCGNALMDLGRPEEALRLYDQAIAIEPRNAMAHSGRGNALLALSDDPQLAVQSFDRALAIEPRFGMAFYNRANAKRKLGQLQEALADYDAGIALMPQSYEAHSNRGSLLADLQRSSDALASYERALAINPNAFEPLNNIAQLLMAARRLDEALPFFRKALAVEPDLLHSQYGLANCAMHVCDWDLLEELRSKVEETVRRGGGVVNPFIFLSLSVSQALQQACARSFARENCPSPKTLLPRKLSRSGPIRIGYLSSDFRRSAMAYQMAELFEVHDRSKFEIVGFSSCIDDGSSIRRRIEKSFDAFHDVTSISNEAVAKLIHEVGVDVCVDLNGYTQQSRIAALAWRPAPVQATYLGYPGTTGASFIDYVIADDTVAPLTDQPFFDECIVHLPGCYQVSDSRREPSPILPSRASCDLPDGAVVFACFNTSYKISAEIFVVWMRILLATPGSVLWLVRSNDLMVENLRQAAAAYGVAPERIIFCEAVEPDLHLARQPLADLFLDTLPYNCHGTGSFALWAGLPILTCTGPTFAGRVATSLLKAVGLPELVVQSLEDYERLAVELGRDPARLLGLRSKLLQNRTTTSLFNTELFARRIEAAYQTMQDIAQRGEQPRSFAITNVE